MKISRRTIVLFLLMILAIPLARGQSYELLLLIVSSIFVGRITRRGGVNRLFWYVVLSPFLFMLLTVLSSVLYVVLIEWLGTSLEFARLVESIIATLRLSWPLAIVYHLHNKSSSGWYRVSIPFVMLALLGLLRANAVYAVVPILWLCIWGISRDWFGEIMSHRRWKLTLLFLTAPTGILFLTRTMESGIPTSDIVITGMGTGGSLVELLRLFLTVFWFSLGFHVIIRSIRHLILGSSIRFRLGLTYVFSTIIPGLLATILLMVAVFAGIGSLKANIASKLIEEDINALKVVLTEEKGGCVAAEDSIRFALFMRVPREDRERLHTSITENDLPNLFSSTTPLTLLQGLEQHRYLLHSEQFTTTGGLNEDEIWLRLSGNHRQDLPDSILPPSEWIGVQSPVEGIVPVGENQAAMIAARPVVSDPVFILVSYRSFSKGSLDRYTNIVRSDLIIYPTQSMSIWSGSAITVGDGEATDDADSLRDRYADPYWHVSRLETSTRSVGTGFLSRPLPHGICELRVADSGIGSRRDIRGFVIVRTSIRDLFSSLSSTRGMNVLAVVVIVTLAGLIFFAVVFSSVMGFSMLGSITQAVGALKRGAEKLRTGDLDTRIKLESRDELTKLADGFNEMAADLRRLVDETAERERLQKELQIARQIQRNLLPGSLPSIPGYQLAADSRPALEVGGDYYDLITLDERRLVLVVADVTGKGIASAMLMSNVQSALRVLLHQKLPLDKVINRLNGMVWQTSTPEMFITLFIGVVDTQKRTMSYVNAGHNYPLVMRDGSIRELTATGMIIGAFPEESHDVESVDLEIGDVVVLYSDGITEAMNHEGDEFGLNRFTTTLLENKHLDADHILDSVITAVKRHTDSAKQSDDITLTVLKLT